MKKKLKVKNDHLIVTPSGVNVEKSGNLSEEEQVAALLLAVENKMNFLINKSKYLKGKNKLKHQQLLTTHVNILRSMMEAATRKA